MDRSDPQYPQHSPDAPTAPRPGDVYTAAATADHLVHCPGCREQADANEARRAEYGESIARRDRLTLGLGAAKRVAA